MKDKVVLITGATSGIGRATALKFGAAGAKVVVSGRREAEGQDVVETIKSAGGEARFVKADVANEAEVKALVAKTVETYGRLDVAFNNAGVELTGAIAEAEETDFRRVFDINVWGVLSSMKHEIPEMIKNGGGAIINTSSIAGHIGMPGAAVYIASKHAVEGLTKTAALEYAQQGVRINAVAPGGIATDMIDRFAGPEGSEMRDGLAQMHPLGRLGTSDEIADAVLFLASDGASFITGESLKVDGGFVAQ
jgi:NAD(P)-dependent dehydrogenase (short-subunit alcohol dehydrogenase family)